MSGELEKIEEMLNRELTSEPGRGWVVNNHLSVFKTRRGFALFAGFPFASDDSETSFAVEQIRDQPHLIRILGAFEPTPKAWPAEVPIKPIGRQKPEMSEAQKKRDKVLAKIVELAQENGRFVSYKVGAISQLTGIPPKELWDYDCESGILLELSNAGHVTMSGRGPDLLVGLSSELPC